MHKTATISTLLLSSMTIARAAAHERLGPMRFQGGERRERRDSDLFRAVFFEVTDSMQMLDQRLSVIEASRSAGTLFWRAAAALADRALHVITADGDELNGACLELVALGEAKRKQHGIVHQSNGFMAVESQSAKAPMSPVQFPAVGVTLAPADAPAGTPDSRTLGRETILLVEDEDAVRGIVSTVLRRQGYQVIEASTPRGACAIFEQHGHEIDLLLTDVVMPEMNGRALAKLLVALRPGLRILFISGYSDMATPLDEENPNVGFLSKPFQASVLAAQVRDMLSRPARESNDA